MMCLFHFHKYLSLDTSHSFLTAPISCHAEAGDKFIPFWAIRVACVHTERSNINQENENSFYHESS